MNHGLLAEVVQLEIPARPEFVGIARMAVAALAGLRTGFSYDRIDDLRIVISEACTTVIEALPTPDAAGVRLRIRCVDDPDSLTVTISGPVGVFDGWLERPTGDELRVSLLSALLDEAGANSAGDELRLVLLRRDEGDDAEG